MMPPECYICGNDFSLDKGGLIYFKEDEKDREYNRQFKEPGYIGHPSNAFWFCEEHYKIAKKYSHLTKKEAFGYLTK